MFWLWWYAQVMGINEYPVHRMNLEFFFFFFFGLPYISQTDREACNMIIPENPVAMIEIWSVRTIAQTFTYLVNGPSKNMPFWGVTEAFPC